MHEAIVELLQLLLESERSELEDRVSFAKAVVVRGISMRACVCCTLKRTVFGGSVFAFAIASSKESKRDQTFLSKQKSTRLLFNPHFSSQDCCEPGQALCACNTAPAMFSLLPSATLSSWSASTDAVASLFHPDTVTLSTGHHVRYAAALKTHIDARRRSLQALDDKLSRVRVCD
jgi:hypothetical protein